MRYDVASFAQELERRLHLQPKQGDRARSGGGTPVPNEELPRLAAQLIWLFRNVPGPSGRMMRTEDLAEWCTEQIGVPISAGYISSLRQGKQSNPSALRLGAIALAFSVPTDFFLRTEVEEQVRTLVEDLTREKRTEAESLLRSAATKGHEQELKIALGRQQPPEQ